MSPQMAIGEFNALAESGGTAIVNAKISKHYHAAEPNQANTALIEMARFFLAGMPLDKLPERATLPPGSNMPFHPNRQFVGRAEEIQRLADLVKNGGAAVVGQSPVISGTGGIGKTQLATELVWRYGQFFKGGVFWISFAEEDSIAAEIGSCGINLNLHPDFSSLPLETQVSMVSSRWQDGVPRLLIFDNCENSELFRTWCPPSGDCRIVLTSRMATWPRDLGLSSVSIGGLCIYLDFSPSVL